jgi:acyl carrier protein
VNHDDARALLAKLIHRIAPEVELDDVEPTAPMQDAMDLDSMDFLNLMTTLHESTGLDVPERDYPSLSTVERFVDYLVTHAP